MSKLQEMQAAIAAMSETAVDMTEVKVGGGSARLLPVGYAYGRLIEVIEMGNQPQEFKGVAKPPKAEVQIAFALYDTAPGQGYSNEDGTPYIQRLYPFGIDQNDKARSYLLFKSLNWKGTAKNFGQLLGEGFLVKIIHEPKSKTDKTIVSRIDLKGFLPPLDPVRQQPYPIPEPTEDLFKYFFWDLPTKATWDSLFIEGNMDDGRSKNFVQERIAGATNFAGSALETMLLTNGLTRPLAAPKAAAATPAQPGGPALPDASAGAPVVPLEQPVQTPVISAPVVAPVIVAPVSVGIPVLPATLPTTSPSSPVLPQ